MHCFRANTWYRSENPRAVCVFVSPVLIPSSTNRRVDHFHPTRYLSHLPAGIFYCMPLRKIITLPLPAWYGYAHAWGTGPAVGWCMCAPCFKLHYFQGNIIFAYAIELSSIYFSSIAVFQEIPKQIQQRANIGKIFALWHLAIAVTSNICEEK